MKRRKWTAEERRVLALIRRYNPALSQRQLAKAIITLDSSLFAAERMAAKHAGLPKRTFGAVYGALRRCDAEQRRRENHPPC